MSNTSSSQIYNAEIRIIFCTFPNKKIAVSIGQHLLNNKLAACITLLNNAISMYYWNNVLEQKNEIQMLIKSHISLEKKVFKQIKAYHPYQIPELLSLSVTNIDQDYLSWLKNCLINSTM